MLVYDTWESELHGEDLVASLRTVHPDTPLVLTSSRPASAPATAGEVWYAPTGASLVGVIEDACRALRVPHAATTQSPHVDSFAGRRW